MWWIHKKRFCSSCARIHYIFKIPIHYDRLIKANSRTHEVKYDIKYERVFFTLTTILDALMSIVLFHYIIVPMKFPMNENIVHSIHLLNYDNNGEKNPYKFNKSKYLLQNVYCIRNESDGNALFKQKQLVAIKIWYVLHCDVFILKFYGKRSYIQSKRREKGTKRRISSSDILPFFSKCHNRSKNFLWYDINACGAILVVRSISILNSQNLHSYNKFLWNNNKLNSWKKKYEIARNSFHLLDCGEWLKMCFLSSEMTRNASILTSLVVSGDCHQHKWWEQKKRKRKYVNGKTMWMDECKWRQKMYLIHNLLSNWPSNWITLANSICTTCLLYHILLLAMPCSQLHVLCIKINLQPFSRESYSNSHRYSNRKNPASEAMLL